DERALALENLRARLVRREPLRAVDLRTLHAAAPGRPFQLEGVGSQGHGIEVAFERPGGDDLAAALHDLAERKELALPGRAGFLLDLALGHRERVLAGDIFAFRDRPGAEILLRPERPARMHQQQLEAGAAPAVEQDAGAALGHYRRLLRAIARVTSTGTAASASAFSASAARAPRRSRHRRSQSAMRGVADRSMSTARASTAAAVRSAAGEAW